MPMPRALNENQDNEVSRLYTQGLTQKQLAKQFSVNICCIESSLKRTKTPTRLRGYKPTCEVDFSKSEQIIADYLKMKSLTKLSKKYGSLTQLRKFLKKKNRLKKRNEVIVVNDKKILELYKQRLTFKEITERTGYSEWCIGKSLKRRGINTWDRRRKIKEPFKIYKQTVRKYTNKSWKLYQDIINPNEVKRGRLDYHVDHIYSVFNGFENNIPPYIIGHWSNLQLLPYDINIKKLTRNHQSKKQLFENYFDK